MSQSVGVKIALMTHFVMIYRTVVMNINNTYRYLQETLTHTSRDSREHLK